MKRIYENKYGVRIEVIGENTDVFGREYITYKWSFQGTRIKYNNTLKESFENMVKANEYEEVK